MARKNKYGNRRVKIGGQMFDSKAEAHRYLVLKSAEEEGKISGLILQPRFVLIPAFIAHNGHRVRELAYVADFGYTEIQDNGELQVVEDVKGHATQAFRLKEKMFRYFYRHIDFRVVKA